MALVALVHNPPPNSVDRLFELRFGLGSNLIQVRLRRAAHHLGNDSRARMLNVSNAAVGGTTDRLA
jgi:hypothetical protein